MVGTQSLLIMLSILVTGQVGPSKGLPREPFYCITGTLSMPPASSLHLLIQSCLRVNRYFVEIPISFSGFAQCALTVKKKCKIRIMLAASKEIKA